MGACGTPAQLPWTSEGSCHPSTPAMEMSRRTSFGCSCLPLAPWKRCTREGGTEAGAREAHPSWVLIRIFSFLSTPAAICLQDKGC